MKTLILVFACLITQLLSAREYLIPPELNVLFAKAKPGMSMKEFTRIADETIDSIYPLRMGDWSGQSGYFSCKVDKNISFAIGARDVFDENYKRIDQVIIEDVRIYIYFHNEQFKVCLTQDSWKKKKGANKSE